MPSWRRTTIGEGSLLLSVRVVRSNVASRRMPRSVDCGSLKRLGAYRAVWIRSNTVSSVGYELGPIFRNPIGTLSMR